MMRIIGVQKAKKVYPTGNPDFSVSQAFPAAFEAERVDPFLMCDYFGPLPSKVFSEEEDSFPVPWHPHIGMDICTYLKQGIGRHADSMGNRGTFKTPGMQWISVGNGIEHAEGGGTPKGEMEEGFQLWFNTPAEYKKKDPKYGTEDPSSLPVVTLNDQGGKATVLAGKVGSAEGPFKTVQPIQVVDLEFPTSSATNSTPTTHVIEDGMDCCCLFVYQGRGAINNDTAVSKGDVLLLDATDPSKRSYSILPNPSTGIKIMSFAGKRIKEPIAWRGPFVMNTDEEIMQVMQNYRAGRFPSVRTAWNYKVISEFPKGN